MSSATESARPLSPAPRVLVVDDDRRVRELLEIALSTHGFGVLTAADGEEAILRAQSDRPDLVLLDVRLPKRSGLEVCDALRNDPADPTVPIVMISAAAEAEQRLHAFTRGADDYMAKPFSPKELVARLRRLLARASESRVALRRMQEMERELASVRREAQRAGVDARREQALRDVADGPARDLVRRLDLESLATDLLAVVRTRTGAATAALLLPSVRDGALVPWAVLGDRFERLDGIALPATGEAASLLLGLRRPVLIEELERLSERPLEITALVAGRWRLVAPLAGPDGLQGAVIVEERADGAFFRREDGDALAVVCELAAVAVANAQVVLDQSRVLLAAAAERCYRNPNAELGLAEARELLARSAPRLGLTPGTAETIFHALAFVDAGDSEPGTARAALDAVASHDPGGLARRALELLDRARLPSRRGEDAESDRPAVLLRALRVHVQGRARGRTFAASVERAAGAAAHPSIADALMAATAQPIR